MPHSPVPMPEHPLDTETLLIDASSKLAHAKSLDAVVEVLRQTARAALGAEGIAVVIREDDHCFYAAEDAVGKLWSGNRFPVGECVSGWAMQHRQTVVVPDTRCDPRIPQDAYAPTFVRSMMLAPIGAPVPVAALGAYWSDVRDHDPVTIRRLEGLATLAGIAIENARLLRVAGDADRQRALMLSAGKMGIWSFDVATGELRTSELCRVNFGRDPDLPFTYADLHAAIHEEDSARVLAAIEASLTQGVEYHIEYRLRTPAGEVRWIEIRGQPGFGPDGTSQTLDGLSIDITERKRMEDALRSSAATLEHLVEQRTRELVAAQEALRQSQKLESMGQLTGGVAHDFNNLLTPILGSLDLLQRRNVGGEREQRLIEGALQSAERARTLVQRLLAFARRQPLKAEPVDTGALVRGISDLVATTIGPLIPLHVEVGEDLPLAHADAHQVEMAIINLSVNARDAMPRGGRLSLSAHRRSPGRQHPDVPPGSYVVIALSDNGEGMDEATRLRAIEPFFSTKGIGKGTGLGLSMAHGLTLQLGGAMTIESELGKGTTISLWLPISRMAYAPVASSQAYDPLVTGIAVLVDDEDVVRASTADMLAEIGFEVIEARSGAEALQAFGEHPHIDVLVTDHLMPGMTGVELAHSILQDRPDLPVLIVSGYSDSLGIDAGFPRLEKPFRHHDLASKLATLLTKDGTRSPLQSPTY
ncbi:response regulator [Sphingomonas sanguinis]|uniref:ATP-binding protein n=1 Tax=Sphingomonas sanguinis TaxID=33051 RepID=UPI001C576253|nr:ATP-binding protein [Sphingomonas sanguinis]QXT35419.1 response regulator [Sphingomonas sanguinis]